MIHHCNSGSQKEVKSGNKWVEWNVWIDFDAETRAFFEKRKNHKWRERRDGAIFDL